VVDETIEAIVLGLLEAEVDFIVVGGTAAVLLGASIITQDVDIVHRRTPENVERLLAWLLAHGAYHRFDLANRRLPPTRDLLLGHGHVNLNTDLGKLDVLCELGPGEGYEEVLEDTVLLDGGQFPIRVLGLPRLIAVKARAGRPKDRAVLPVLIATLDDQRRRQS
jgi:predicted nucleotidyltransferase